MAVDEESDVECTWLVGIDDQVSRIDEEMVQHMHIRHRLRRPIKDGMGIRDDAYDDMCGLGVPQILYT